MHRTEVGRYEIASAEKVYRAIDAPAERFTRLTLGSDAAVEWLPRETILFDDARLRRRIEVDVTADARFLAVRTLVLGRAAARASSDIMAAHNLMAANARRSVTGGRG